MSDPDWRTALVLEYGETARTVLAQADALLPELARPELVVRNLQRFLGERAGIDLRSFACDPLALDLLLRLCAASQFGADICRLWPGVFWEIVQDRGFRQVLGRRELTADLIRREKRVSAEEHRIAELIRFQRYHLLRIMLGDIAGSLRFTALVGELSDLTDAIIGGSLRLAEERLAIASGPRSIPFAVLALGKLGSRELNYSSDIDLIFLGGTGVGDASAEARRYLRRLGQSLLDILGGSHPAGRLYRVDLRLRPHGERGEVAMDLAEMLNYYYSIGRGWERQALIKARTCAGDLELGERLLAELDPWIYPRERRGDDLREVRAMRRRIAERAGADDLKGGTGGIRDIEFLVQSCQLAHGGRHPELRRRSTLQALEHLASLGIVSPPDRDRLRHCYIWLRMVEHRLQMWEARQLHALPADPDQRRAFARRCGYAGPQPLEDFEAELSAVRDSVRRLAERYYLGRTGRHDALFALLASETAPTPADAAELLAPFGFADPAAAAAHLRALASEPFFLLSRARTEEKLLELLPILLEQVRRSPDPDLCLANVRRIVDAVGGRAEFYALLLRRPKARRIILDLAGWADYAIDYLTRYPAMPDEVFEALRTPPADRAQLEAEARALTTAVRDPLPQLAYLQARELVEAAIRDLQGAECDLLARELTDVAAAVLEVVVERCIDDERNRHGEPRREDGAPSRFAVLGLGKLGSGELTYASDMDVIFVCDPGGGCRGSDRESERLWEGVAKRIVSGCHQHKIYAVDPRLRPWGEQGQLVINTRGLARYWQDGREVWERLAMTRATCVAGDAGLGREAETIIHRGAWEPPLPTDARARIRHMRTRLEKSVAGHDDLKRGPGGYVDIEFIAHLLGLEHLTPVEAGGRDVAAVLARLGAAGHLEPDTADRLVDALRVLRRAEARIRLYTGRATSRLPRDPAARARLARCCGYPDRETMDTALSAARETARTAFAAVMGGA